MARRGGGEKGRKERGYGVKDKWGVEGGGTLRVSCDVAWHTALRHRHTHRLYGVNVIPSGPVIQLWLGGQYTRSVILNGG